MQNESTWKMNPIESRCQVFKAVGSNAIGAFSFSMFQYGMSFMLLRETHSPLSFGINLVIAPLVNVLSFIPIGNFVDNHDHKKIILWGYLLRLLGFIILGLVLPFFTGKILLIPVAIFIAVDSILVNTRGTAYSASVRQFVDNNYVAKLSSLTTAFASASRIVGPVLGITLYTLFSIEGLIVIEVIATLIAFILMTRIHFYNNQKLILNTSKQSQFNKFKESFRYMKSRPFIYEAIIAEIIANFFFTAVVTGGPFIVVNELHLGNQVVAIIETGFPMGYLLGSLITGTINPNKHLLFRTLGSLFMIGAAMMLMGYNFMFIDNPMMISILGALAALILNLFFAVFDLAIEVTIQSTVNEKVLGRVSSTLYSTSSAIAPIGTIIYTTLFGSFSNGSMVLITTGCLLLVYVAIIFKLLKKAIEQDKQYH